MLKDIRIKTLNGERLTKVIILKETEKGIVYIPLNAISRVDYNRLTELYYRTKDKMDLLEALREERLDNGRNGLVVYKDVIKNKTYKTDGNGKGKKTTQADVDNHHIAIPEGEEKEPTPPEGYEEGAEQKKRGPGRPRKYPRPDETPKNIEFPDDD